MTTIHKFVTGTIDANFYENNLQKYADSDVNDDVIIEIELGGVDIFHCSLAIVQDSIVWLIYHHDSNYLVIETPYDDDTRFRFLEFNLFDISKRDISDSDLAVMIYPMYHHLVKCIDIEDYQPDAEEFERIDSCVTLTIVESCKCNQCCLDKFVYTVEAGSEEQLCKPTLVLVTSPETGLKTSLENKTVVAIDKLKYQTTVKGIYGVHKLVDRYLIEYKIVDIDYIPDTDQNERRLNRNDYKSPKATFVLSGDSAGQYILESYIKSRGFASYDLYMADKNGNNMKYLKGQRIIIIKGRGKRPDRLKIVDWEYTPYGSNNEYEVDRIIDKL